jgi:hypothetical protein
MDVSDVQLYRKKFPISLTLFGTTTDDREVSQQKLFPILITL